MSISEKEIQKEEDYYGINRWGEGYFGINSLGHVVVKPNRNGHEGDLYELTQSLVERGIEAPILIRFNGIIRDRIKMIHDAFSSAIRDFNYRNHYRMAFPIKVNPQFHVVELVHEAGKDQRIGLEVGSKPELIAVLALEDSQESLLLCNGYKDAEYISIALMSRKLGRRTIIIIEQVYELQMVLEAAENLKVEAEIGLRMKLSHAGAGRWKTSAGDHSKFGLFTHEIMTCLQQLEAKGKQGWLKLLHYHMGSQIPTIESVKKVLKEGARMYTELAKDYPSLTFFDVGGGLAVDYDGSRSTSDSSMNYSVEEYARDVVAAIGEACLEAEVPDPVIITESGRAIAAHHAVLITEVIDVTSTNENLEKLDPPPTQHDILVTLASLFNEITLKNCRETLHDAMEIKERIVEEFLHGTLSLRERAYAEKTYRLLLMKVRNLFKKLKYIPEEMAALDEILREIFFCNFSVFQSLPDSWAISQLFPVMPIQRLYEKPVHEAILADLSCDSDGKIDCFVGQRDPKSFLLLHDYPPGPYYLGVFLVGAYQEILGGLHNLFGDTNVVHAELDEHGRWELSRLVEGDTIEEVLRYVQYSPEKLMDRLRVLIEKELKSGKLTHQEAAQVQKKMKQALESYTYLVV